MQLRIIVLYYFQIAIIQTRFADSVRKLVTKGSKQVRTSSPEDIYMETNVLWNEVSATHELHTEIEKRLNWQVQD